MFAQTIHIVYIENLKYYLLMSRFPAPRSEPLKGENMFFPSNICFQVFFNESFVNIMRKFYVKYACKFFSVILINWEKLFSCPDPLRKTASCAKNVGKSAKLNFYTKVRNIADNLSSFISFVCSADKLLQMQNVML